MTQRINYNHAQLCLREAIRHLEAAQRELDNIWPDNREDDHHKLQAQVQTAISRTNAASYTENVMYARSRRNDQN